MSLGNFASTLIIHPNPFIRHTGVDGSMRILSGAVIIGGQKLKQDLNL